MEVKFLEFATGRRPAASQIRDRRHFRILDRDTFDRLADNHARNG
jgi:hypothetical protein